MGFKDPSFLLFFFFILVGFASSSSYVSYESLGDNGTTGRSLLQAKQACTVNFEAQNYTIITSKCKGPNYNAKVCCDAFLEFACPFNEEINDMKSDCATTMFSYINLYGRYPPGLFANMCKGDKEGLSCGEEHVKSNASSSSSSSASPAPFRRINTLSSTFLVMMILPSFLLLLFVLNF
ncbi:hypothetical protein M9H77_29859 [Catharanthus roseus]|uniref:Uncharacterized protein n=1 Tax=Catharanthus roseus TaxID=4058 RepID=A0ACB9ZWX9_CATRO|nr:hypothetical protein M9H77_29859 [Catharanthus roseus]